MRQKTKIVILEGTTSMNNVDLAQYLSGVLAGEVKTSEDRFTLTQKPKVQVAQPAKEQK